MVPEYAMALKARRRELGLTQQLLEAAIETFAADKDGRMSQRTISNLEAGDIHPLNISVRRFGNYLAALEWTTAEFSSSTGLAVRLGRDG